MPRLFVLCLLLLLGACAHPTALLPHENLRNDHEIKKARRELYRSSVIYQNRLEERVGTVFYNLIKSTGTELCDRKLKPGIGVVFSRSGRKKYDGTFQKEQDYVNDYNAIHKKTEGNIYVNQVYKGSAAFKAGLRPGDKVVSIYGMPVPSSDNALEKMDEIIARSSKSLEPVELTVERRHQQQTFSFVPDEICPYDLIIDTTMGTVNAYANGENMHVSIELVDYIQDDDLLAAVLSHELAHSTMGHINDQQYNTYLGMAGGIVVDVLLGTNSTDEMTEYGQNAYSKDYEFEADYLSVYYMYRAGYDIAKAKNMQRALSDRDRSSIYSDGVTHPQPQERFVLLKDTVEEIKLKEVMGDDILPNMKERNSYLDDKKDY